MYNSRLQLRVQLVTNLYLHIKDMDKTIEAAKKAEKYVTEGIELDDIDKSWADIFAPLTSFANKEFGDKNKDK